jgi:hypothetical protein
MEGEECGKGRAALGPEGTCDTFVHVLVAFHVRGPGIFALATAPMLSLGSFDTSQIQGRRAGREGLPEGKMTPTTSHMILAYCKEVGMGPGNMVFWQAQEGEKHPDSRSNSQCLYPEGQ